MTQLVIPYAPDMLNDQTREFGVRHNAAFMPCFNDHQYWRVFHGIWNRGSEFVICEHDIIPTDEQYKSLIDCPEPWCVGQYDRLGVITSTLGFAKFDPTRLGGIRLEQWDAGTIGQAAAEHNLRNANPPATGNIAWNMVDGVVGTFLANRGYAPHVHTNMGLVEHARVRRAGDHE